VQAKIISIHHFKHQFKHHSNTPETPDGMVELWALLGNGVASSSQHIISPRFLFCDSHLQSSE
jgi:hypothetical protein